MESDGMGEIVVRLRHKALQYREAAKRIENALSILEGPAKADDPKQIEGAVVEQREDVEETVAEIARVVKRKKGGLTAKLRQAVAKIGPVTTGELTAWLHAHGFPDTTSNTVSALCWELRNRKEFSKDSEARWTYTGGL